jgi:hypothetical protein
MYRLNPLTAVKLAHTAIWAVLAGVVFAIPLAAHAGHWGWVLVLTGAIVGETVVLLFNRMRCPLTDVAARYTEERQDNFDIYLPLWLARHNKSVFGTLFALGEIYAGLRWAGLVG